MMTRAGRRPGPEPAPPSGPGPEPAPPSEMNKNDLTGSNAPAA
jgi:hypothetical protein